MIFSLAIYSAPTSPTSTSALHFVQSALEQGHQIYRVFFYHDGVLQASELNTPPQDEHHISEEWRKLAKQHELDMVVCIAAGLRRGILDEKEAERYEKNHQNLSSEFELSGLGQLLDATVHSDRLLTFAG